MVSSSAICFRFLITRARKTKPEMCTLAGQGMPKKAKPGMAESDDLIDSSDPFLAPTEAGLFVRLSAKTLQRYSLRGLIPSYRLPNGERRYRKSDLVKLLSPEPSRPDRKSARKKRATATTS
jgi:hypothetical protein